ncbi:MAG: glycosyltransferase family 2 protein [Actinobacteria bacterium]|nr:glycosyltransferase family 2 protein [Actinomycetota bacterium]
MNDAKVLVAGAGRAGTVLLLQVLTDLGLDTGFERSVPVAQQAGLRQVAPESPKAPRIVADPTLPSRLGTLLDVRSFDVEHVIVPIRQLDVAAASRLRAGAYGLALTRVDSPLRPSRATGQRAALGTSLYDLMYTIARFDLPHTFLLFPRFARDWEYLFKRLGFLDPRISPGEWRAALERRRALAQIDERPLQRHERLMTVAGELGSAALVQPWRALERGLHPAWTQLHGRHDNRSDDGLVTVHVASLNTRFATELCIRTMRQFAGRPFRLVVGDCGSTDGSLEMLRSFERRGWLKLEVAPNGRMHAEWLDKWLRDCATRYALFVDSDVEFFQAGWLDQMVRAAQTNDAALVCAQMLPSRARYMHPHTGAKRTLGARPAPWLLLVDVERVRGRVSASFAYVDVADPDAFGGKIGYDVAGAYFAALRDEGLGWVEMPESFRSSFRHFSGLSWRRVLDWRAPLRLRPGQAPRMAVVMAHLWRARALRYGEGNPNGALGVSQMRVGES